jgi:hypothetical protein
MAHGQKPDFVFRRNGRVHLNRRGRQFSRLLAAEVYASAVVMLDTPCSEVVWRVLATHSTSFPLHSPSRASPCAIIFQLDSTTQCGWRSWWQYSVWGCKCLQSNPYVFEHCLLPQFLQPLRFRKCKESKTFGLWRRRSSHSVQNVGQVNCCRPTESFTFRLGRCLRSSHEVYEVNTQQWQYTLHNNYYTLHNNDCIHYTTMTVYITQQWLYTLHNNYYTLHNNDLYITQQWLYTSHNNDCIH